MPILTVSDLVEAIERNQLLHPHELDTLKMNLQTGFSEPAELAEDLVRRGTLSLYQAKQIFLGKAAELLLGQYVIVDRLGEGAMGQVYKARHRRLDRLDAVKVIRPEHLAMPNALGRFHQEARAAARLSHPNIVTIYDADRCGDRHFIAMEYVDGIDLSRLVQQFGPLPVALACDYVIQAAHGLHHAHTRDLVHRDVKPSNLLVTNERRLLKVLDMGLALFNQPAAGGPTHSGVVMGTPDYIAPEQAINSHAVDTRADVYSLGCTLYFLLTGRAPFPGGTPAQKLLWHQQVEPTPVENLRTDLPPALAAAVRRMMAKRAEDRFQTPAEVAEVLEPLRGKRETPWVWATSPAPPTVPAPPTEAPVEGTLELPSGQPRRPDGRRGQAPMLTRQGPSRAATPALAASEADRPGERSRRPKRGNVLFLMAACVILGILISLGWFVVPWTQHLPSKVKPDGATERQGSSPVDNDQ